MSEAFILSACRTPIGKFGGSLSSVPVTDLGAIAVREAVARAGIEPSAIEDVILGIVLFAEPATAIRLGCISLIIAGIAGLKLTA